MQGIRSLTVFSPCNYDEICFGGDKGGNMTRAFFGDAKEQWSETLDLFEEIESVDNLYLLMM